MKGKLWYLAVAAVIVTTAVVVSAQGGSQGTVTITVLDQSGAVVPGTDLSLQDVSTNEVRKAATLSSGGYSFVGLNIGTHKLPAARAGYAWVGSHFVSLHGCLVTGIKVERE